MFNRVPQEETKEAIQPFAQSPQGYAQTGTETQVENFFDKIKFVEDLDFEKAAWESAKSLFHAALRELKYFGNVSELEAFSFQMRDKHGDNSVEIFGVDDGEFHIKMHTGRFVGGVKRPEPILLRGGDR